MKSFYGISYFTERAIAQRHEMANNHYKQLRLKGVYLAINSVNICNQMYVPRAVIDFIGD